MPKVFISYAHADREWASRLSAELTNRGFQPFFDYNSLRAGQDWQDQLRDALISCDHLVVLWSKDAQKSDWVSRERATFDTLRYKGKQRLPGHIMVHIHLDNRESAYGSDQAISEIFEANAHAAGAPNLPAATWTQVADRVAAAFGEESMPITTAVVTLTREELESGDVNFAFKPIGGRSLNELLADMQMTGTTLAQNFYGATRRDWKPFGGAVTIAQLLDEMRVALNAPQGVTPVRWVPVDDDLFSGAPGGILSAAGNLSSGLALLLIDPIALYSHRISTLLNELEGCYQNPNAAIVVLPIFAPLTQPRTHYDMVKQVYRRLVNIFYEDPPLSARMDYAQCSVLAANDADVRRMVRSMLRHYVGKEPAEGNRFLAVRR